MSPNTLLPVFREREKREEAKSIVKELITMIS